MAQSSKEQQVLWGKVVAQAWNDDDYKARLIAEPRSALAEAGYEIPDNLTVSVVEQQPGHVVFALPPRPAGIDSPIGDDSLDQVAGGICYLGCYSSLD